MSGVNNIRIHNTIPPRLEFLDDSPILFNEQQEDELNIIGIYRIQLCMEWFLLVFFFILLICGVFLDIFTTIIMWIIFVVLVGDVYIGWKAIASLSLRMMNTHFALRAISVLLIVIHVIYVMFIIGFNVDVWIIWALIFYASRITDFVTLYLIRKRVTSGQRPVNQSISAAFRFMWRMLLRR